MFDIGWSELLVIGVVAIVVVGPKELPRLMRTFGHYTGKIRAMASDFQRQFDEAVRDTEIDEVRKAMQEVHAQASDVRAAVDNPLTVPNPAEIASAAATPASRPTPKAKPKRRTNKPKPGTAKIAAPETTSTKTPRAKKREDGAP